MSGTARWDAQHGLVELDGLGCGPIYLQPHVGAVFRDRPEQIVPWTGEEQVEDSEGGWSWRGPGFRLQLRVEPDADGFRLLATLEATKPLRLAHTGFTISTALLQRPGELRFFRQGYASWTPTASLRWDQPPRRPLSRSFAVANHYIDSRWWGGPPGMASHGYTLLTQDGQGLLVGFLANRVGLGEIFLGKGATPFLVATLDFGGRTLGFGEALALEPLRVGFGPADATLERYLDEAAVENGVDLARLAREPVVSGWCSWYHFYTKVKDEDVVRNARAMAGLGPLGLSLVQLDDGYQTAVGDWRSLNGKFKRGLGPMAQDIRALGYNPGLWTAPFMAGRKSQLVQDHPDWVLRDPLGEIIDCGLNPAWRDRLVGLDLSHEGARAWLHTLFRGLREEGFTFFKLDFLYAALRHAQRKNPAVSPVESYRLGMSVIRDAVGDGFLLGCGAPILPSVGLVDGMRVSGDVKERWGVGLVGLVGADCGAPSLMESARNNITRAAMHRRWWLNDPDCLLVRDQDTDLDADEVRLLVTVAGMTGGLGIISDDLDAVPEARRALLASVLPPTSLRPQSPDLFLRPFPERFLLEGEDRRLVAEIHWGSRSTTRPLEPAEVWRFDAWEHAPLSARELKVPSHGVRAWWETPRGDHPRLVGADLHLTGLVDGRISERFTADHTELCCRDLPPRAGRLWLATPAGWALRAVEGPARLAGSWAEGVILAVEPGPWTLTLRWTRGTPSGAAGL